MKGENPLIFFRKFFEIVWTNWERTKRGATHSYCHLSQAMVLVIVELILSHGANLDRHQGHPMGHQPQHVILMAR